MSAIPLLVVVSRSVPEESRSLLGPAVLVLTGLAQPPPVMLAWLAPVLLALLLVSLPPVLV
jgi:hypothetical protein